MDAVISFLNDGRNKPLRDLIELAVNEDDEAVKYMNFIQEEIAKKFKNVDGSGTALDPMHLSMSLDQGESQDAIRGLSDCQYYFNEFGVLKNASKDTNELTFSDYERIGGEIPFYLFHVLTTQYKFKAKVVGNQGMKKKKKKGHPDFTYKTLLFSPKFEQCDSVVVMIPPHRGGVTYNGLAIDEGLAYGTMLPYIEQILSWNPKLKKKKKKAAEKSEKSDKKDEEKKDSDTAGTAKKQPMRRWGILILDPQGKDVNNNKYSIIKVFDKWLNKRIPSSGLGGFGFQPRPKGHHKRKSSLDSITSSISSVGSDLRIKVDIKNLFFVGALGNAELISHLFHRRGQSVQNVTKGCIFLGADDPYDANDVTQSIYARCGVNYLNSKLPRDTAIEGNKMNGDPYIIRRVSSGGTRYCCAAAYKSVIKFLKEAVEDKPKEAENGDSVEVEEEEAKND